MTKDLESKSIERLMAEADELIRQINSDAVKDMKEEHRVQIEKHAQNLEKIKSEVHAKIEEKVSLETISPSDGMHEAMQEIVTAMQDLKNYLF